MLDARRAKPLARFYGHVSDAQLRDGTWRVVGNAPLPRSKWKPEFVIIDILSDELRGELVIADRVRRRATRNELKTLPEYSICGSDLMAQRLAKKLKAGKRR